MLLLKYRGTLPAPNATKDADVLAVTAAGTLARFEILHDTSNNSELPIGRPVSCPDIQDNRISAETISNIVDAATTLLAGVFT